MRKFTLLVLTDHSNHSSENALYPLVQSMRRHPRCKRIDVATRKHPGNDLFFKKLIPKGLLVQTVDESFVYHPDGRQFKKPQTQQSIRSYDVVWLRLPPPLSEEFLSFLKKSYPNTLFINDPAGIWETGSKAFLLNFPDLCPPIQLCESIEDIEAWKNKFPIVLKPLREYGGRGIIRIDGDQVWDGNQELSFSAFAEAYQANPVPFLGVKFLTKVANGDKRIVVINGKIMGASLRLPPKDSWICNVSMGGSSHQSEADEDERHIIERLHPELKRKGIVMYGVDTTSIGGLPAIDRVSELPIIKIAGDQLWQFITEKSVDKHVIENE